MGLALLHMFNILEDSQILLACSGKQALKKLKIGLKGLCLRGLARRHYSLWQFYAKGIHTSEANFNNCH